MDTKKQNLLNNTDLESLMNIVNLNSNMMEATKSIKSKNNESAIKSLKALKDKPGVWPELIITAFSSQNFKAVEFMFENYGIDLGGFLEVYPSQISSDVIFDQGSNAKNILTEKEKDIFTSVTVPFSILAATSGDIDIFHYVKEKGGNLNASGHMCLSKKQKNSVISNILGTAAYYGRSELTDYILKKHSADINYKCVEKKVRKKQISNLIKEFSEMTPLLLAVVSDAPESNSIEVIKHLLDKNANLAALDLNKNTILHLAVKHNKLEIIKYFQDILIQFLFVANKEGQTPFIIAQENNFSEILGFLNSISTNPDDQKNIEDELNELIESTNQQKNKRKKKQNKNKGNKDEVRLLNSAAFQETFKIKQPSASAVTSQTEKRIKNPELEREVEEIVETRTGDQKQNRIDSNKTGLNEEEYKKKKTFNECENENFSAQEYDQDHYYADRSGNRNTNYKQRGYNNYNKDYGYDYNYNYQYEHGDYEYSDRYGYGGYNSNYKAGRYGYQNYEKGANNGKYYKTEKDYRGTKDNTSGNYGKSQINNNLDIIEQPLKYEEKYLPDGKEKVDKSNNENPIINNTNQNIEKEKEEKICNDNKDNKIATTISEKEKEKVNKEKKIIGLDAKTLKKIEKKEKKAKTSTTTEKRKISKDELASEKEILPNTEICNDQEEVHIIEAQLPIEKIEPIKFDESIKQEKHEEFEISEEKEDKSEKEKISNESNSKVDKIDNYVLSEKDNVDELTIEEDKKSLKDKQEQLEKSYIEKEEIKNNIQQENRMENIFVNEDLLYSKENIKKYFVEQCLRLEESLEKEKREKEKYYNAILNKNLINAKDSIKNKNISQKNTNDKLEDLLHLANQELETKSKKINQLNSRLEYLELSNIKSYNKKELEELKDFFSNKLSLIVDALTNTK